MRKMTARVPAVREGGERKDCQTPIQQSAHDTSAASAQGSIAPPRFETAKAILVAGVGDRFSYESSAGIPGLWARFHQHVDGLPGRIGKVAYGVCTNPDDAGNFDYIAGVEVADFSELPRRFRPHPYSRATLCGVHPQGAHLGHPPHDQHDLE